MKTIIVTGDSRGLGAAITQELLSDEYEVIGLSRNGSDEVSRFEEEYPDRFNHINFDLENSSKIEELYKQELKSHGPIHGLVNNAAMPYDDIVTNIDRDVLSTMFEVNVISPMMLTKYTLRDMMLNRTEGSIVHISSVSTASGYKGLSMYGATKGALESFSLGVAREWGERGIRSNCIAPGFMDTDMTSTLTEDQKTRIYDRTGLGEPTDEKSVANTVEFLLSEASSSITGEIIRVDTGTL
jgi:3-oxoacyl-[acyl-carrier protein] reductase